MTDFLIKITILLVILIVVSGAIGFIPWKKIFKSVWFWKK
jgi:hypothetical protein